MKSLTDLDQSRPNNLTVSRTADFCLTLWGICLFVFLFLRGVRLTIDRDPLSHCILKFLIVNKNVLGDYYFNLMLVIS